MYAELHLHTNYSFQEGASSIGEMVGRAVDLGYRALAITDHDNLCGAVEFADACHDAGIQPIIGCEVTLTGGCHLTLLSETRQGYGNLCRLISQAYVKDRRRPELDPVLLEGRIEGLIALSGCRQGQVPSLLDEDRFGEARDTALYYRDLFGRDNYFLELQQHLVLGDTKRNRRLVDLAREIGVGVVATGNVHYHVRDRHRLQDCLAAVRNNTSLEDSHRLRRPNSEFFLKHPRDMAELFQWCPDAVENTARIALRCRRFDLTQDLGYQFPDYPLPEGRTPQGHLEQICRQAAERRYGRITPKVQERLKHEFSLIEKHNLAGFFLIYHDIALLGREVAIDLGLADPETPLEFNPPGRGRGSSVSMLVGYLLGISHIDPLQYDLSLERFLPDDEMASVPDIDLDFPRNIREELILRVHRKYGWERAALTGMIETYRVRGTVRDLGQALGLPPDQVDKLAKRVEERDGIPLGEQMRLLPDFQDKLSNPVWQQLVELSGQLDGFPRQLAQHPGGMVIGSSPLTEIVPVQPSAIEGRYVMQWDKDSIDRSRFVKIDFLAVGALSQLQDTLRAIEERHGNYVNLSCIDFDDLAVYAMLHKADTIGIFQVESAAQQQTIPRIKPRNLTDMAHEVAAVRPWRRSQRRHSPLHQAAHGTGRSGIRPRVGAAGAGADQRGNPVPGPDKPTGPRHWRTVSFRLGPVAPRVHQEEQRRAAPALVEKVPRRGVGQGPQRRDRQAGVPTVQRPLHVPRVPRLRFRGNGLPDRLAQVLLPGRVLPGVVQPAADGFLHAGDAEGRRQAARCLHMLNPDVNLSSDSLCTVENDNIRLGLCYVKGLGDASIKAVTAAKELGGPFADLADFMARSGLEQQQVEDLIDAGALDSLCKDRRRARWEAGLRYRPVGRQLALGLPVEQDMAPLSKAGAFEEMVREYRTMRMHPSSHVMAYIRQSLGSGRAYQ